MTTPLRWLTREHRWRILLAWALSQGCGHLAPYLDFVKRLLAMTLSSPTATWPTPIACSPALALQAPLALRTPAQLYRVH